MSDAPELKPCPFCGPSVRKPVLHKDRGVKCHTCGAWGPAWEKPDGSEWNRRADLVPAPSVTVETIIAVADEIMSDLSGYLADDLTTDDEQEATDLVRRVLASAFYTPGWQPIETAPRDGTEFLAYWQFGSSKIMRFTQVMKWDEYRNKFIITWDHDDEAVPTHWMPIPSPPSEGKP